MKLYNLSIAIITITLFAQIVIAAEIDHSKFDTILQQNVENGRVNYAAIKENDTLLVEYLHMLENIDPSDFNKLDEKEKLALWINAYNAITIYGIVLNYPIEYGGLIARVRFPQNSIRQIGKFWDTNFIDVIGQKTTLNHIEHEILRKEFDDPRIHFAIVCASIGCPILRNSAYTDSTLNKHLDDDVRSFAENQEKVFIDTLNNRFHVSPVFKWYAEDFQTGDKLEWLERYNKKTRGFVRFIVNYLPEDKSAYIIKNTPKIKYLDYDWSLNELKD